MVDRSIQTIKGYELIEQIGVGGYGVVYRAYQPSVGREVAIKVIVPEYANHPDFIRRFEAEAQLVARLEHPHIVPLYDYWREPGGAYLVMRFLRGGSLHNALKGEPWTLEATAQLLDQLAPALTVAHRRGIVHRDLKPANILLDEDGNAYLADFGIAKDLANPMATWQTGQAGVVGSPAYISPEQIKAEPITAQTDIYSLGVMLYEILTGELPFQGPTPIVLLFKHVHEPIPSLRARRPDLPATLDAVIQRATAKIPADRYPDVLNLVVDFRRATGLAAAQKLRSAPAAARGHGSPAGNGDRTTGTARRSIYDTAVLYRTSLLDVIVPAVENPYKGLRAFQEGDAADFFGREALTQRLLERLGEPTPLARFLAVVGPSGSGKSSVVKAGLIPALRHGALPGSQRWFVVEMLPGAQPLEKLEEALLRVAVNPLAQLGEQLRQDEHGLRRVVAQVLPGGAETELVLLIDQFEEVFTLVEDEVARTHFLTSLLAAVSDPHSRLRVIITLRADFYDRPLLYTGLSEIVRQRTEVVVPLAPEELRQAIVRPAERIGIAVEPDLVAAMLHDVNEQPGALPLLQYALTELFERRSGRLLTLQAYRESGGVLGALARRADEIYAGLSIEQQDAARQLFLRLVTLGEGSEDTRRRVPLTELLSMAPTHQADTPRSAMQAVLDTYHAYRLLTFDRDPITRVPTAEVAHEALIRTWARLRDWLDASRDDLRLHRRLTAAAAEWAAAGHDSSFLASGVRLEQLAAWAAETHLVLNQEEQAYLQASLAERDAQRAREEARRAREAALERRSRTFLRALAGVLLLATLGALALTGVALNQRQVAESNAQRAATAQALALVEADKARQSAAVAATAQAQAEVQAARAQHLAVSNGAQVALREGNVDLALMLALIANTQEQRAPQSELILAEAAYAPGTRWREVIGSPVQGVAFSPDGRTFLVGSQTNVMLLYDTATHQPIRSFEGHSGQIQSVAFSPDGTQALSASEDETAILWDLATGRPIYQFKGHVGDVKQAVFSPDGTLALTAASDATLKLWDLRTGQLIRTFSGPGGHTQKVRGVAFSPDGKTALSGSTDANVILWDVATGTPIRTFQDGHTLEIFSVAFSPDGKTALSGSKDTTMIVWDVATGRPIHRFRGHSRDVWVVRFSPDGKMALSGALDNTIGLWNIATGEPIRFLTGHGAEVRAAAFSPIDRTLLTGASDGTVRLWDLDSGALVRTLAGHTDQADAVAFSPDGRMVLSGALDTTTRLWEVATGQELRPPAALHNKAVRAVAFSPDGKTAISSSNDTTLILEEVPSGRFLRRFDGHTGSVNAVAFSPDDATVLSGGGTGDLVTNTVNLILWDVATAKPIRTFDGHTDAVTGVAFSPDGTRAVSGSSDKTVIVWEVATAKPLHVFKGHDARVRAVAFSPDGRWVLSAGEDRMVILWDLATGQSRIFKGHNGAVRAVAFSPDGTTFASASDDTTVLLWDIEHGAPIRRFEGHRAPVLAVTFSPDGHMLASAAADQSVRLWRVETLEELIAWTRANRFVPPLSCDQQRLYNLDLACEAAGTTPNPAP